MNIILFKIKYKLYELYLYIYNILLKNIFNLHLLQFNLKHNHFIHILFNYYPYIKLVVVKAEGNFNHC